MLSQKQRRTLNVDLGDLKPLVETAAKNQGRNASAWVRQAIELALMEDQAIPARLPPPPPANRRPGAEWVNFGGRLTLEQSLALAEKAAAEGCSQIELVARMALDEHGEPRSQMAKALMTMIEQMQSIEFELRRLVPLGGAPVQRAVRELRIQVKRASAVLAEVSATRRTMAARNGVK